MSILLNILIVIIIVIWIFGSLIGITNTFMIAFSNDGPEIKEGFYKEFSLPQRIIIYIGCGPISCFFHFIFIPFLLLLGKDWRALDPKPEVEKEKSETWKV